MIDNTFSSNPKSLENSGNQYFSHNPLKNTPNNSNEDHEVDKYMSIVEKELKALGYTLDNRAFISNIITILDKLIEPNKFNKTIFFHILDYANLNPDSLILLLDFFKSFFNVYESMKKNKTEKVLEINKCQEELNIFRTKMIELKKEETVLENGLTNNSILKISAVNIAIDYQSGKNSLVENSIKLKFVCGNLQQEIDSSTLNRKVTFNVNTLRQLEENLRIFLVIGEKEIFVERINPRDILDSPIHNKYKFENIQFELNLIWINSKINYFNKQIAELETKISDNKEAVNVLNNSIIHIEETFKKYFSEVREKQKDSIIRIPTQDQGTMNRELEVSQKIEDYMLKMLGKEVITWDKIVFLSNKIILLLMMFILLKRGDFLTLFVSLSLICIEYKYIKKTHCYKILIGLMISIFLDFFWILYYLSLITTRIPLDGNSAGIGSKEFCLIISSIVFLLKMILAFSLWRLALEYKLFTINKIPMREQIVNYYSDPVPQMKNVSENESTSKVQRLSRPTLKYFIPKQHRSFILRNLEEMK